MSHDAASRVTSFAVGVMARAPSAGGKTRLAADLSPARLVDLRRAFLADTLEVVGRAADTLGIAAVIFYTPVTLASEIAAANPRDFDVVPQADGNLGDRMRSALTHLLTDLRFASAVIVGTDIPLLNVAHLDAARDLLGTSGGVVIGPADDGGYFLIGMTEVHRELFEDIEWGSATVLTDTLRTADRIGMDARLVPSCYDVDTITDLERLRRELAEAPPEVARQTRAWFREE